MNELEKYIRSLGWFGGKHTALTITIETDFEGFYGRASESWEQQVTVKTCEIKNDSGKTILPQITITGKRSECIDDVCKKVMNMIRDKNGKWNWTDEAVI